MKLIPQPQPQVKVGSVEKPSVMRKFKPTRRPPVTREQRAAAKVGSNDPCPCGRGLKYKLCCLAFHERVRRVMR